jgi:hypothetical protein
MLMTQHSAQVETELAQVTRQRADLEVLAERQAAELRAFVIKLDRESQLRAEAESDAKKGRDMTQRHALLASLIQHLSSQLGDKRSTASSTSESLLHILAGAQDESR